MIMMMVMVMHGGSDSYGSDGNSSVGSQTWFQFLMFQLHGGMMVLIF